MSTPAAARRDPYAVIRPHRGRVVPVVAAVLVLVTFTASAIFVPGRVEQKDDWALSDRIMLFLMGAAIAAFLWRFVMIRAQPSKQGLEVRNLFVTRRLEWGEIVRMQFGGGAPWAYLDTWDADTVPLMAIQKADGEHGRREAARLAALIDFHSGREPERPFPLTSPEDSSPQSPDERGSGSGSDDVEPDDFR